MEGPYSEVAKDREEGNIVDHNPEAADHRSEVSDHNTKAADNRPEAADHNMKAADNRPEAAGHRSNAADNRSEVADHKTKAADNRPEAADHKTKAADNRPEAADHNTKAADHNTPEHNDCLPADGCLTASRFPESVSVGISPKKRENKASMLTPYTCRYPVMAAISRPFSLHIFFVQSIDPST